MTLAGRLHRTIRAVLVHGAVPAAALAVASTAPWVVSAHASVGSLVDQPRSYAASSGCSPVDTSFRPTTLSADGILEPTRVLALGEDAYGVPRPPPLTDRGKWQLAWDKEVGVRPGDKAGVVRLTAHTYPAASGAKAPALGNLLLQRLRTGDLLKVSGATDERLCYRVTRRQQVRSTASLAGYYDTTGKPRLAILVCSGKRLGPGSWTHRTIWYADPLAGA